MIRFKTLIRKYGAMGEKTGWTYIEIPADLAEKLKPGNKKSFRVKGKLDQVEVSALALVPVGGGDFILPLKKELRKALKKEHGASLVASLEPDDNPDPFPMPGDFKECLADEPAAVKQFNKIPRSHQHYFIKWIESARTDSTRTKRIAIAVTALSYGQHYGEMIRSLKNDPDRMEFRSK